MMQFNFVTHAIPHCFGDGSGLAIYSAYTGETIVLRSKCFDASMLKSFSALPHFNLTDIQNNLGLPVDEAERVLQYLLDSHLVTKAAVC